MLKENILEKKTIYLMLSTLLSFFYVYSYLSIPNRILKDRANYIIYANDPDYFLNSYQGLDLFFNEPIFLLLNKFYTFYFVSDVVPLIFVFFNTSVLMFFLIKKSNNLFLFLLGLSFVIVFPYLFQSQLTALRQALAISVFLISFFYFKDHKKIVISLIFCSFIHSIFFLISFFYFFNFILLKRFSVNTKLIFNFLTMLSVSIIFFVLLEFLGFRQANEYGEKSDNVLVVGGGAFLLMAVTFIALFIQKTKLESDLYLLTMIGLVLFLTGYFINPIAGRLFNSFAPFLMILLVSKPTKINFVLLVLLCLFYSILYFNGAYNEVFYIKQDSVFDVLKNIDWIL